MPLLGKIFVLPAAQLISSRFNPGLLPRTAIHQVDYHEMNAMQRDYIHRKVDQRGFAPQVGAQPYATRNGFTQRQVRMALTISTRAVAAR